MYLVSHSFHIGKLKIRHYSVEFTAVFMLPAGVEIYVAVSVFGNTQIDHAVRYLKQAFLRNERAESIPRGEAEKRSYQHVLILYFKNHLFYARAESVFCNKRNLVFSGVASRA